MHSTTAWRGHSVQLVVERPSHDGRQNRTKEGHPAKLFGGLVFPFKAFRLKEGLEARRVITVQVDALLFTTHVVEHDKIRVVVSNPRHFQVLPIFPPLILLKVLLELGIVPLVQLSSSAALNPASCTRLGIHDALDNARPPLDAAVREAGGRLAPARLLRAARCGARCERGEDDAQPHHSRAWRVILKGRWLFFFTTSSTASTPCPPNSWRVPNSWCCSPSAPLRLLGELWHE